MHFLSDLSLLFCVGVVMVVIFHRLRLPPVLGFLTTGMLLGPYGLRLVEDGAHIQTLAEIGLVLLLFEAGIEFSVDNFMKLRRFLLIAGGLQLLGTIAGTMALAHFMGMAWQPAIFLGMLISLSSTAIVLRILEHRGDIETAHGRAAFSILIFQDLCLVPMVLAAPFLAGQGGSLVDVAILTGKALLFLGLAASVARYLVPMVLNQVARTKKREAFVLSIMLLCLGTATATSHFGLSMALGAFIAGLILSSSSYSHQALGEIIPFREVFNCLVFVSIGMLFDVSILLQQPILVAQCLLAVLIIKALIGLGATVIAGHTLRVAILTGFTIAQISEFSFVLAKLGLNNGLLDAQTNQLFLAVAIMSMFLTPAFLAGAHWLTGRLEKLLPPEWMNGGKTMDQTEKFSIENHAIVVGYGNAGRDLAALFGEQKIPFVALDVDPDVVREEAAKGTTIFYGDATRQEVLAHAGIAKARVIAFTVIDPESAVRSVELARRLNPRIYIVARARRANESEALRAAGASEVILQEAVIANHMFGGILTNFQSRKTEGDEG